MKDLKLDESGDLIIDKSTGNLLTVKDKDETVQLVTSMLNTFIGELAWNKQLGLNQTLLISSAKDKNALQTFISEYLKNNLQGFETLKINDAKLTGRNLSIDLTINLRNGLSVNTTIGGAN